MKKLISIALALMLCISILSVCAFAAPEGINSMAIVGSGIPGVGEWDPSDPAADMEEVEESVYVKEIVCDAACTMTIKFAGNDAWDDTCNFGSGTLVIDGDATELECGGGSGDMALEVTGACTLKFTLDLNGLAVGGAATVKVEQVAGDALPENPDEPENPVEGETVRLHAYVPTDWANPCCWAWTGSTNAFAAWPGEAMTQDGEWYVIDIPNWVDSVIVNGNDGGVQTSDLTVEAGKDVWLIVGDSSNVTVAYEEPAEIVVPTPPVEETEPVVTEPKATEPEETVAPETEATEAPAAEDEGGMDTSTIVIIVCGVIIAVAIVAAVILLLPKKKEN